MDYLLSLNNATVIPFNKYEHNFTFIVNGKQYKTSRIIADLLSPTIRNYHFQDPTINEFSINTSNTSTQKNSYESQEEDYFNDFLNLYKFEQIHIEEPQRKRFIQYFLQLGNIEESLNLQPKLFEDLKPENIIDKINEIVEIFQINQPKKKKETMKSFEFKLNEKINKIISYAASYFYKIPKEQIKSLNEELLEEIISNEKFKIDSEDDLLEFIIEKYKEDRKFYRLFEYVEFQNVDEEMIKKFISVFNIDDLSLGTWQKICKRLAQSIDNKKYDSCIEKPFIEGQEFKGIMKYLTDETKGNIHDNGTIEITSNSILNNNNKYHPKNLVEYQNDDVYYESFDTENAEIIFDFKDRAIQLTNYSLKTYSYGQNGNHLKSWSLEVSNDGNDWSEIDSHTDDQALNHSNAVATFNTKKSKSFYRFIKLHQTGKNWYNNYFTHIINIEFYGKIKQAKSQDKK